MKHPPSVFALLNFVLLTLGLASLVYIASLIVGCASVASSTTQPTEAGVLSATDALRSYTTAISLESQLFNAGTITAAQFKALAPSQASAYAAVLQADRDAVAGSSAAASSLNAAVAALQPFTQAVNAVAPVNQSLPIPTNPP